MWFNYFTNFSDWFWLVFFLGLFTGMGVVLVIWKVVHWLSNDDWKY